MAQRVSNFFSASRVGSITGADAGRALRSAHVLEPAAGAQDQDRVVGVHQPLAPAPGAGRSRRPPRPARRTPPPRPSSAIAFQDRLIGHGEVGPAGARGGAQRAQPVGGQVHGDAVRQGAGLHGADGLRAGGESGGDGRRALGLHPEQARPCAPAGPPPDQIAEALVQPGDDVSVAHGNEDRKAHFACTVRPRRRAPPSSPRSQASQISKAAVFLPSALNGL